MLNCCIKAVLCGFFVSNKSLFVEWVIFPFDYLFYVFVCVGGFCVLGVAVGLSLLFLYVRFLFIR